MIHLRRSALVAGLIAVASGLLTGAHPVAAQEGPSITLDRAEVHLGEPVIVSLHDFTTSQVTVAVCGNLAKLGSADCNMPLAQSERIRPNGEVTLTQLFAQPPPVPCPCLVRAYSATSDEFAIAPIVLLDHPYAEVVDPTEGPLVEVTVDAERVSKGMLDSIRTTLGGPTTYAVTVSVRNVTTVTLTNLVVSGSARHPLNDDAVSLEIVPPPPIEPGRTWQQTVEAEVPAPVVGRFTWSVVASGAGSTVEARRPISASPTLLFVLAVVFLVDLAAIVWRFVAKRRRRRAVEDDGDEVDARFTSPAPNLPSPFSHRTPGFPSVR